MAELKCTACGKAHSEVRKLVSLTQSVMICDECVSLCVEIIHDGDEGSGLATLPTAELALLRHKAQEGEVAKIWIKSIRNAVATADKSVGGASAGG